MTQEGGKLGPRFWFWIRCPFHYIYLAEFSNVLHMPVLKFHFLWSSLPTAAWLSLSCMHPVLQRWQTHLQKKQFSCKAQQKKKEHPQILRRAFLARTHLHVLWKKANITIPHIVSIRKANDGSHWQQLQVVQLLLERRAFNCKSKCLILPFQPWLRSQTSWEQQKNGFS